MTGTFQSLSFSAPVFFQFSSFQGASRPLFLVVDRLLPPSGLEGYFTSGRFADFGSLSFRKSGQSFCQHLFSFSPRIAVAQVYCVHVNVKCDVLVKLKGQNLEKQINKDATSHISCSKL